MHGLSHHHHYDYFNISQLIILFFFILFNSARHLFFLKWCKDYLNRLQHIIIETKHPLYVIFQDQHHTSIIDWSIFDIQIYWLWKISLQFNISLHTNVWQGHSMIITLYHITHDNDRKFSSYTWKCQVFEKNR